MCKSFEISRGCLGHCSFACFVIFLHLQGEARSIPVVECLLLCAGAEWEGQASKHAGTVVCAKCSSGGSVRAHRAHVGGPLMWTWEVRGGSPEERSLS